MMDRFERQVILREIGTEGQTKLQNASVLLIGLGGLGCPILNYLSAAGVGKIGLVDGDLVSISNLNRQTLYGENHVGELKTDVASRIISKKYSDIKLEVYPFFLNPKNAFEVISQYDLVIDGTDNFPTRYLVNDICFLLHKPLVFGAIFRHEGQVSVFNLGENACNYRDLFPNPPSSMEVPNCSETGVLGVLPGLIGTLMATESIKVITGYAEALRNRVLFFDSKTYQQYFLDLKPNAVARNLIPKSKKELEQLDYEFLCSGIPIISWEEGLKSSKVQWLDVRESHEMPKLNLNNLIEIPLSEFYDLNQVQFNSDQVFVYCQSGIRSQKAAVKLKDHFPHKEFISIRGGVNAYPKN